MKEVVLVYKPRNMQEMIAAALSFTDSSLQKVVHKEVTSERHANCGYSITGKTGSSNEKWKSNTESGKQVATSSTPPNTNLLTNSELDEFRRLGLCFKCKQKWSKGHECPLKELRIITVVHGYELEVLDSNMVYIEEEESQLLSKLKEISLHVFLGMDTLSTTKVKGWIGGIEVVILLDTGATHNFINPTTVQRTKLVLTQHNAVEVQLRTCIMVDGMGVCWNLQFSVGGHEFVDDFISLELGNTIDAVLGVKWLKSLGEWTVDLEKHEWRCIHNGHKLVLQGEPGIQMQKCSLKSLPPPYAYQKHNAYIEFHSLQSSPPMLETIPAPISDVLASYNEVFAVPT